MRQLHRYRLYRLLRELFGGLPARAWLTLTHLGPLETTRRIVTFPLRLLPFAGRLGFRARMSDRSAAAVGWYRRNGRSVGIVIPTYGDPSLALDAVRSIQATTDARRVRIIVADDGSAPEHQARLREARGIDLVLGDEQRGFAANCNRGIARLRPDEDLVLLNSDIIAHRHWLELLQHGAYRDHRTGIAGPKLLYADGTIQSAGSHRNLGAPEWFDHRYRFQPAAFPPANVPAACIAVTGAAMYVRRECLDAIGLLDEDYGMAYEDVDWCLKAWVAGFRVVYWPASSLTHLESKTRGMDQGDRELASQRRFWDRWGDWFDARDVRAEDGGLRIVYVTHDTGIGGGHRVVFQHLRALRERGHHVELWSLDGPPDWFDLGGIPVRSFDDYDDLTDALAPLDAIKVATWWQTALPVWIASVARGVGVYFVQDIETSYYPRDPDARAEIIASYRHEFRYLTTSSWNVDQLRGFAVEAEVVPPGLDANRFDSASVERRDDVVLAVGRTNPLKNFPLTRAAWSNLPEPRPELLLYGVEPKVADAPGMRYVNAPSDQEVDEMLRTATVFVQTSDHEGFCLPILEAMAAGTPVVCTDADGNRDFCRNGENCLMPETDAAAVTAALSRVLGDPALRQRLSAEGRRTAHQYAWDRLSPGLQTFYETVARTSERSAA